MNSNSNSLPKEDGLIEEERILKEEIEIERQRKLKEEQEERNKIEEWCEYLAKWLNEIIDPEGLKNKKL